MNTFSVALSATLSLTLASTACTAFTTESAPGPDDVVGSSESAQSSSKPACTPDSAPRRTAVPVPNAASKAKIDAWTQTSSAFTAAAVVIGRACVTNADCATSDAAFPGTCLTPYYGSAQCTVDAPARPLFTCADYTCPASFECEQEGSESIACLEHRLCRPTAGNGNGGGGRNR